MTELQVLVDADNVAPPRLQPVLDLLAELPVVEMTASGRPQALDAVDWPRDAKLLPSAGWQRADVALAEAYRPGTAPLLLVTGDGDFGLLAARHAGPVLVVSGAASGRLRDSAVVVDPAVDGVEPIRQWLIATGSAARRTSSPATPPAHRVPPDAAGPTATGSNSPSPA